MLIKGGYTVSFIKSVRMKTQKYFAMVGIWLAVTVGITQNGHKHLILTVVSQLRISSGVDLLKKQEIIKVVLLTLLIKVIMIIIVVVVIIIVVIILVVIEVTKAFYWFKSMSPNVMLWS